MIEDSFCTVWDHNHGGTGYAACTPEMYKKWRVTSVPRWILCERYGRLISRNEWACHTCDNRWCVEPSHIYLGTPRNNAKDTWGRHPGRKEMNVAAADRNRLKNQEYWKSKRNEL